MKAALLSFMLLSSCSTESNASKLGQESAGSLEEALTQQGDICRNSGGHWHDLFISCRCPAKQLFSTEAGCTESQLQAPYWSKTTTNSWSNLTQPRSRYEIVGAPSSWDEPWVSHAWMEAWTLAPSSTRVKFVYQFDDSHVSEADSRMLRLEPAFGRKQSVHAPLSSLINGPVALLRRAAFEKAVPMPVSQIVRAVRERQLQGLQSFSSAAQECYPSCGTITRFSDDKGGWVADLGVDMIEYVPVRRWLDIVLSEGDQMSLYLSADGHAESMTHISTQIFSPEHSLLARTTHKVYDDAGSLVRSRVLSEIDRRALNARLEPYREVNDADALQPSALTAAIMEDGFDLQLEGLASMLRKEEPLTVENLLSGTTGATPGYHSRHVSLETLTSSDHHGASIGLTLLRDLPHARLSLVSTMEVIGAPSKQSQAATIKLINDAHIRVFVIAQDYSQRVPQTVCRQYFETLFSTAQNTLFVVAAGNNSIQNAESCPAWMATNRPNVVTVAGATADGLKIAPESNYGAETVDVAGPFAGSVPRFDDYGDRTGWEEFSGTSYTAAWVGNLALRYFSLFPTHSPSAAKAVLYDACSVSTDLDVGCGGNISSQSFRRILDSLQGKIEEDE